MRIRRWGIGVGQCFCLYFLLLCERTIPSFNPMSCLQTTSSFASIGISDLYDELSSSAIWNQCPYHIIVTVEEVFKWDPVDGPKISIIHVFVMGTCVCFLSFLPDSWLLTWLPFLPGPWKCKRGSSRCYLNPNIQEPRFCNGNARLQSDSNGCYPL